MKKPDKKTDNLKLIAALQYAGRGWRVIPLHSIVAGKCTCRRSNCKAVAKHPRITDWQNAASADHAQIRAWWSKWPNANIGLVTGKTSGLAIIDIDKRSGGLESLASLENKHGRLLTLKAQTGGGGVHLYFKHPGTRIGNSSGRIASGIDVKGDGGYVVAPPSMHASGKRYRWDSEHRNLEEIPTWLQEKLAAPTLTGDCRPPVKTTKNLRQFLEALK